MSPKRFFVRSAIGLFVVLALASIGWFGYYTISPIFIHIQADDALPESTQLKHEMPREDTTPTITADVVGTPGHPASGTVRIIETGERTYVRYENFKTLNGPDIYVYLAKDKDAQEYINLGQVKATEGNINYEIPMGTDISQYRYVLTWCKQFGVLFNYAKL